MTALASFGLPLPVAVGYACGANTGTTVRRVTSKLRPVLKPILIIVAINTIIHSLIIGTLTYSYYLGRVKEHKGFLRPEPVSVPAAWKPAKKQGGSGDLKMESRFGITRFVLACLFLPALLISNIIAGKLIQVWG